MSKKESIEKEKQVIKQYALDGVELLNVVHYVGERRERQRAGLLKDGD